MVLIYRQRWKPVPCRKSQSKNGTSLFVMCEIKSTLTISLLYYNYLLAMLFRTPTMLNRTFEPNMITMFGFVHTYLHAFRPYPFFSKIYCVHLLSSSTSWLKSGENQMKALKNRRKNIGICTIFSFLVSFFWGSYNNGSLILLILVYFLRKQGRAYVRVCMHFWS